MCVRRFIEWGEGFSDISWLFCFYFFLVVRFYYLVLRIGRKLCLDLKVLDCGRGDGGRRGFFFNFF